MKDLEDPEDKRKAFKKQYFNTLLKNAEKLGAINLVQGTQGLVANIKTYNNFAEADFPLKVIEPLRGMEKKNIRAVAEYLEVPREYICRQPFPGPGFVVRIGGEVTQNKLELIREVTELVDSHFSENHFFQYFPYLMQEKTVGIKDEKRQDGYTIALRIVDTKDNVNYFVPEISQAKLSELNKEITTKFPEVTRVLLDITSKPPACVEYQ